MPSLESKLFNLLLILIRKKRFLEMQFTFGKFDFYNSKEPPREIQRTCHVTRQKINGRNVFTLAPKGPPSQKHILYFHGGAYVQNFVRQHWTFMAMLVTETNCTITAPDYPLAPRFTYHDAYDMIVPIYEKVLFSAGANNTILMGDSSGGGLALGLAHVLKEKQIQGPVKIILLSPWLDITLSNPDIITIDRTDPFLSVRALQKTGLSFAGNSTPEHFMLSPVNGSIEGLGEISVFVGTRDIMVADSRKLKQRAENSGFAINYREYKDMVHVWMFLNFPEARAAKREIVELIRG